MTTTQLLGKLDSLGLRVRRLTEDRLEVVGDQSHIDAELRAALIANRQVFLDLLPAPESTVTQSVQLGNKVHEFAIWQRGEQLRSPIAIDTETELIKDYRVPRLALASVSDGQIHRLIKPTDLDTFISVHAAADFVAHNAAFDFEVIRSSLQAPAAWETVADDGRLHCTMLLDALIRLGRDDGHPQFRNLGELAEKFLKVSIDKNDPYRRRYAELIDQPWSEAEPGFFTYAIKDAIVTRQLWNALSGIAAHIVEPHRETLLPGSISRYGLLTESLQVRAAIALAQVERHGVTLDQKQIHLTSTRLSADVNSIIDKIQKLPEAAGLFKFSKDALMTLTRSGKPATNQARLREVLDGIAKEIGLADVPRTSKTGAISCSTKYWGQYADRSAFLALRGRLEETSKLCQFFSPLKTDRIHPRYSVLVRTGRTSCSSPNIQQLPRAGGFREMIVPSAGHYFLCVDYAAIELRTLAAVCERRFGESRLAEVLREGTDPHAFTAAMFEGITLEAFNTHPDRTTLRQRAKALNFGIPGGLGARSLVEYAAATYGVALSIDQASSFRSRLVEEVYPELKQYLDDDSVAALARNLQTSVMRVRHHFDTDGTVGAIRRIVSGWGRADGGKYGEAFVNRVWQSLAELNANSKLTERISRRETGGQLAAELFAGQVATLTGRVRGGVSYSQARNTPFQGLAADGAKLALWRLYREGFRTVAFIHDEMLIELPVDADHTEAANQIDRILCESMEQLTGEVPVECEYALTDRWRKGAEKVIDADGRLQLWTPSS